jgi:7-cyano-7-deazaguanine synthase
MTRETNKAVVLLSGGLDSATALAIARAEGFACHALSFDYGQRHRWELSAARAIAADQGVADHRVVRLDLSAAGGFGHSALTDAIDVPKDRPDDGGIPVTYVPARNTIFLSIALGLAEVVGAWDIFLGVNAVDYSGYPDCRPAFVAAFEELANLATAVAVEGKGRFRIHAPLVQLTKGQIIARGLKLGVDYSLTHSCYDPLDGGRPCGRCDSCRLRRAGFRAAGSEDPLDYPADPQTYPM